MNEINHASGIVAGKPSGVDDNTMTPDDIVLASLKTAEPVKRKWRSSSNTPTYLELYRAFPDICCFFLFFIHRCNTCIRGVSFVLSALTNSHYSDRSITE